MYTQCSNCATVFHISAAHLRQAQGLARCSECHAVFDALHSFVAELPAAAQAQAELPQQRIATAAAGGVEEDLFTTITPLAVHETTAAPAVPPPRRSGLPGVAVVLVVLLGVLVLPYAYLMREELGRYPQLRPWVDALCQAVGCELPHLRDVGRIHILYKNVSTHSTSPANLVVHATIVNDSGFRQPYPQIRFRFLDPVGAAQASRWFAPDDYLTEQQKSALTSGMPPQEPVAIRLYVADMDVAATDNFVIDLR